MITFIDNTNNTVAFALILFDRRSIIQTLQRLPNIENIYQSPQFDLTHSGEAYSNVCFITSKGC